MIPIGIWAIKHDDIALLKRLAQYGADLMQPKWCHRCKPNCSKTGTHDCMKRSVLRDPEHEDFLRSYHLTGRTAWAPLALAAKHGSNRVMEYLLTQGADVEAVGFSTCRCEDWPPVDPDSLLPGFSEQESDSESGYSPEGVHATPLYLAICNGQLSTVELLLRHGADPDHVGGASMGSLETAVHLAVHVNDGPIFTYLLENKVVRLEERNERGATALHMAYLNQNSPDGSVNCLLEAGADINAPLVSYNSSNTWTLFAMACAKHDLNSALSFLRAGADPEFIIRVPAGTDLSSVADPDQGIHWTASEFIRHIPGPLTRADSDLRLELEVELLEALDVKEIEKTKKNKEIEEFKKTRTYQLLSRAFAASLLSLAYVHH